MPVELGVVASVWEAELTSHPDPEFAAFIFWIGYDYSKQARIGVIKHMHLARKHVDYYGQEELGIIHLRDREIGSMGVHVSKLGIISKPHQPGK